MHRRVVLAAIGVATLTPLSGCSGGDQDENESRDGDQDKNESRDGDQDKNESRDGDQDKNESRDDDDCPRNSWTKSPGGDIEGISNERPNEIVYAGSTDGWVKKWNTHGLEWTYSFGTRVEDVDFASALDAVVACGADGSIHLIGKSDGDQIWKQTPFSNSANCVVNGAGTGNIFSADAQGNVVAISTDSNGNSNEKWSVQPASGDCEGIDARNDDLVLASDDHNVYQLDDDDGRIKWSYDWGGEVEDAMYDDGGKTYACGDDATVRCLEDNGSLDWSSSAPTRAVECLVVADGDTDWGEPNGTVWAGDGNGYVTKLDPNGNTVYQCQVFNTQIDSITLGGGGNIYLGNANGKIANLDET